MPTLADYFRNGADAAIACFGFLKTADMNHAIQQGFERHLLSPRTVQETWKRLQGLRSDMIARRGPTPPPEVMARLQGHGAGVGSFLKNDMRTWLGEGMKPTLTPERNLTRDVTNLIKVPDVQLASAIDVDKYEELLVPIARKIHDSLGSRAPSVIQDIARRRGW